MFWLGNWVDDGPFSEKGNKVGFSGVGFRRKSLSLVLGMLEFL